MSIRELSTGWKQAILKRRKDFKGVAQTLGVARTTVWNVLKIKKPLAYWARDSATGRPRKTTQLMTETSWELWRKSQNTTVGDITNDVYRAGMKVPQSTVRKKTSRAEIWYRGRTTTCKALMSGKNRKTRCEFTKKNTAEPQKFWNQD